MCNDVVQRFQARAAAMEKNGKIRQIRAVETRKRIVAVAKKLIAENGFENVCIL